jgi:hypothetical protein
MCSRWIQRLRAARVLAALVRGQLALAQADRARRDLDQLVVRDVGQRLLQGLADRRRQEDRIVLAGGADVGQLLGLERVHVQVVRPAILADDHAAVHLVAWARGVL